MSDLHTSPAAAPPAQSSRETASPSKVQANSPASPSAAAPPPHITCFACSRCEYPVCDSNDLLLRKVRQGASEYAFQYNLDGLLDLEDTPVPCYSAAEVVHTSVVVSEALMKVPLPPAAQVVALESIVQSRKFWVQQRRSMNARLHEHGVAPLSGAGAVTGNNSHNSSAAPTEATTADVAATTNNNNNNSSSGASVLLGPSVVRRYGDSAESRIDLVCVQERVLEAGVQECTQDRSAAALTLISNEVADKNNEASSSVSGSGNRSSPATTNTNGATSATVASADAQDGGTTATTTTTSANVNTTPTVIRDPSFAHVPTDVLKAATAVASKTQWSSPGNMSLREAYMEVNRTTLSSRAPWFQDYRCVGRVQCPDCHQALGYIFEMPEGKVPSTAARATSCKGDIGDGAVPQLTQGLKRPAAAQDREVESADPILGASRGAGQERRQESASFQRSNSSNSNTGQGRNATGVVPADTGEAATTTAAAAAGAPRESGHAVFGGGAERSANAAEADGARLPHAKKMKNENDAQAAAAAFTRRGSQEALQQQQQQQQQPPMGRHEASGEDGDGLRGVGTRADPQEACSPISAGSEVGGASPQSDDSETDVEAPPKFVGLELKRIVQRDWDLRAFQERYNKARELSTFRELFPEAEELQSLYSRLLGLRTQTELYNSLLRRHKEQNDVQMALLNSNKDRMHTYDEKIKTMQQIIEAQRAQIEMQTRQIRNQEELVQSHRRQFVTQQRQMDVEQMLLSQQSKTIESQKEQLRLLKTHFQATQPEVLEEVQLTTSSAPSSTASLLSTQLREPQQQQDSATSQMRAGNADSDRARDEAVTAGGAEDEDDDEDEDESKRTSRESSSDADALVQRRSPLCGQGVARTTPPAHLCGVPTSFPPHVVSKAKPPAASPRNLSPREQ